jgi:pheromone shutdown protein TraB
VLTLIGTGHVFDLRRRLQREVMARAPDVVCLELDPGRFRALLAKQQGAPMGDVPLVYRMLAEFQSKMAAERGIAPGDEMLAAFECARDAKVQVELIDMDAQRAFQRLWSTMGLVEKARFVGSAALGMVLPKRFLEAEMEKLQGDYGDLFDQLARDYPTVKRVLIDERNAHMAARLAGLRGQGKERIVAVVGDGHVEGLRALLTEQGLGAEVEAVRLRELSTPEPAGGSASWSFSTTSEGAPPPPMG